MITVVNDLFNMDVDAICITTNGDVRKDGSGIMGAGIARIAKQKFPGIERNLGNMLKMYGNVPQVIYQADRYNVVSFPTKPTRGIVWNLSDIVERYRGRVRLGQYAPGWMFKSSSSLIARSAKLLKELADLKGWKKVALPLPGCGQGELSKEDVIPLLEAILDDRFILVLKERR